MNETLTIRIPYDLARYAVWQRRLVSKYETNQVIRALDTWLVLKSLTRASLIQQWNKQKADLLQVCKCSEAIFRHRCRLLSEMKLLIFTTVKRTRDTIKLCSWEQLEKVLGIDTDKKLTIQYNKDDKAKLHQWLIAAEIKDNQDRQDFMVLNQVNKNPELQMILIAAMIKNGADHARIQDPGYFLSYLKSLYLSDFVQASEIHDDLIEIRPDNNRSVRGMASAWNCKHPTTVSYWKGVLKKAGIIDISHLQVQSGSRARNKHCKVLWLPGPKETLLCLCDQIQVLQPWLIQNLLAA